MNNRCQINKKTKRIENICNSLRARADLQTKLTETANIEKRILGAQNTVDNSLFSDHSELKVNKGQTACSERTARCNAISSEIRNTSESSSSDESTTNSKGSRPFHCLECGKSFAKQTHLNQHREIHIEQPRDQNPSTHLNRSDVRNFKSSDIARNPVSLEHKGIIAGNRSSLISLQVERSNFVLGIEKKENFKMKRFECSVCQKSFKSKCNLKKHMRIHTGVKSYECEVCNKAFARKDYLTKHARIHTGEKPYKCDECNSTFYRSSHLINHKRIHTGEKPFKCDVCNTAFSQSSHLRTHKRIHERV